MILLTRIIAIIIITNTKNFNEEEIYYTNI
jgi:hypothetical protein